ncbi:PAS domain S-box protein [Rapidithrix thailandica]|uniref:histidine kinase n=1 Tax=Rapidithrix thailandica TaxID=413964 RepID=A0AAW9S2F7_9BACT
MEVIEQLKRKVERERKARKQAERILEEKALELYKTNLQLKALNERLEKKVTERTKELEQSEARYRQLVETAHDIIFKSNFEGYFTYANPIAEEKLGYSTEEIVGQHFSKLVHENHVEKVKGFYENIIRSQVERSYFEFPVRNKSGEVLWVGQNVQLIFENDQVIGFTGVVRDITRQKKAEQELLSAKLRLTHLIANLQSGVLMQDAHKEIIVANQTFCKMFQIPLQPEELVGSNCIESAESVKDLFTDPECFTSDISRLLREKKLILGDELVMKDGRILERDFIPIVTDDEYIGYLWQYRDVTENRKAHERIKKSEEKYRGIIENMELGLLEVDRDGKITRAFDRFCEMLGYAPQELKGKEAISTFVPAKYHNVLKKQTEDRKLGKANVYEVELLKKSGEAIWVMLSGAPIFDEQGKITGSIGIHYNITRQKKLQQALRVAKQKAEEAQAAEKDFLAKMSHEIRTPLNAVVGMVHLLYETPLNPEQTEYVDILKSASKLLQGLINDILDISKINAGHIEVQKHEFNLLELIHSIGKIFEIKLDNCPVSFGVTIDPNITKNVIGDDLLLNQILVNLLSNALKFTEQGNVTLDVKLLEKNGDTLLIQFTISDTGIGIPEEKLEDIFKNFKQVDREVQRKFGGTGLGLAIVKQLVELQNGNVSVSSRLGKGSTFKVILPYSETNHPASNGYKIQSVDSPELLHNYTILVAEDNPMNRKYVGRLLEKWGVQHEFAINGKIAIDKIEKKKYDLVLMDVQMPELDGITATKVIREKKYDMPILALTASALSEQVHEALTIGMSDYLPKPFAPEQLKNILHKHLLSTTQNPASIHEESLQFQFHEMLDQAHLDAIYEGDMEYALEMFELFFKVILPDFEQLQELVKLRSKEEFRRMVHKLKPSFSMIGLTELTHDMSTMEELASAKKSRQVLEEKLHQIQTKLNEYLPIIKNELQRLKNNPIIE